MIEDSATQERPAPICLTEAERVAAVRLCARGRFNHSRQAYRREFDEMFEKEEP